MKARLCACIQFLLNCDYMRYIVKNMHDFNEFSACVRVRVLCVCVRARACACACARAFFLYENFVRRLHFELLKDKVSELRVAYRSRDDTIQRGQLRGALVAISCLKIKGYSDQILHTHTHTHTRTHAHSLSLSFSVTYLVESNNKTKTPRSHMANVKK